MKKLLTLVLCWFIAFSAMAETTLKAKTALSAAGGYITSLNKVDGSFEDGSTQWSASVGTIVPTASTEFQGNYKGVWAGTGTGTLNLQWTATASNTYEASAQVNVQGEDDVYVCAYVGTTETGCKLIPALNKIQKVSVVADSVISSAFYLRLKHTGSDAFSIDVDDGKIEPWTPQAVNLAKREFFDAYGNAANSITAQSTDIPFSTVSTSSLSGLGAWTSSTTYTAKEKHQVCIYAKATFTTTASRVLEIYRNGQRTYLNGAASSTDGVDISKCVELVGGEYITVREVLAGGTLINLPAHHITITATAISDNVVQSWQDGTEWTSEPTVIASTGTNPTKGAIATDLFRWKRDGGDLVGIIDFEQTTAGTSGTGSYLIKLPSNLQIDVARAKVGTTLVGSGRVFRSLAVMPMFLEVYSSQYVSVKIITSTSSESYWGASSSALDNIQKINFNSVRIPIQGWSSAPTLLALPTSKINEFSATISGIGIITNPNADFISSCSANASPPYQVDCVFKASLFSAAPNCTLSQVDAFNDAQSSTSRITNLSSTQLRFVQTFNGLPSNGPSVRVVCQRSSDYTAPGVFVGSLAKDYTAYVDSSEVITNATDNFITSCTNADPTVCTFASTKFGTAPYCNAQKTSSADVYVTTTSTTSVTIERADSSSPFSLFCQIK